MLLACVVIWSANVSFVKLMLRYWSPFSLGAVRMCLALAAFAVIVWVQERSFRIARRDWFHLIAAGAFGIFMNQACFVLALKYSHASSVALLLAMIPVFAALISASFSVEPFTRWSLIGLPVSLIGVFLIISTEPGSKLSLGTVQGDLFAMGTALSWAAYTVLLQPLLRKYSPARISFWVIVVGLIGLIGPGIASFDVTRVVREPWWSWALVLYSSLLAIFTTNFLWYLGTHKLGPARGSLYAFLQPFLGVLLAVLILGDAVNLPEVAGGVVIIAGILLARRAKIAPPSQETIAEEAATEPPVPA